MLVAEVWIWFSQFGKVSKLEKFDSKAAFAVHFTEICHAQQAASSDRPVMGDPKIEIIYNVGGQTLKADETTPKLKEEEEKRLKKAEN